LRKYLPEAADRYPIEPGTTVGEVADRLAIPRKEAKLVFVNSVRSDLSTPLSGGERVGIFPPVGGG
jgi:molybdopterin converting factor small subunit